MLLPSKVWSYGTPSIKSHWTCADMLLHQATMQAAAEQRIAGWICQKTLDPQSIRSIDSILKITATLPKAQKSMQPTCLSTLFPSPLIHINRPFLVVKQSTKLAGWQTSWNMRSRLSSLPLVGWLCQFCSIFSLARLNLSTKGGLRMRPLSDTVDSLAMPFGGPAARLALPSIRSTPVAVNYDTLGGPCCKDSTQTYGKVAS